MRRSTITAGFMAGFAACGALLVALRPSTSQLPAGSWWSWLQEDPERALLAVLGAAAWAVAAWLFVVTGLSIAAATRGSGSRSARRLVRLIAPIALRRALEAGLATALAVGPAGMAIAGPAPVPSGAAVTLNSLAPVPAPVVAPPELALPDLDRPSAVSATPAPSPTSSPIATAKPTPTDTATPAHRRPAPSRTKPPAAAPTSAPATPTATTHLVVAGDTLWDVAAAELPGTASPADITRSWQDWYTRNRGAIGADPALITPGQLLVAPAVTS